MVPRSVDESAHEQPMYLAPLAASRRSVSIPTLDEFVIEATLGWYGAFGVAAPEMRDVRLVVRHTGDRAHSADDSPEHPGPITPHTPSPRMALPSRSPVS